MSRNIELDQCLIVIEEYRDRRHELTVKVYITNPKAIYRLNMYKHKYVLIKIQSFG